uniref:Pre-mRNA-processing protein 40C isoform X1 n=2 Tax=Rhizophora mucronata TaxID=61149 RepID=A0A2P2JH43_RHIMU
MSQSVSLPLHSSSSSTVTVSSSPILGPATSQTPANPSSFMPRGLSVTPGIPGPPGLVPPPPVIFPSAAIGSATAAVQRPNMINPSVSNLVIQQQTSPILPSLPPIAASPQGHWLQLSQMVGAPRPPYLPYPAVFSGPFHLLTHDIPQSSDSQTPGITSAGTTEASLTFSAASVNPLVGTLGMQADLPPGIDANPSVGTPGMQTELPPGNEYHGRGIGSNDNASINESLDAWTAHKTDAGVVYYYNAVTGVSTYQKPLGLKGECDVVPVQPTPVSMKSLAGTDWALITTNDGKKYYYNNKTKLTSWQIPSEVTEFRKRQEADLSKDNALTVPPTDAPVEKVSTPISGTTINTSRDGAVARASIVPGSASALDLIKKKLQDSGTPVTSSSAPVSFGLASSESNGPQVVEATIKGLQSENNKDKLREANGDGNMTDSSSDSEDEDDGPTKEECIIQFKEMLKERGVAPFSKWEKELPKIVFDPRFKAIPSHSARRSLFERYVKTRAEEERKEKRAAQRAAIEGFKQLLEEASADIDQNTDYQTFKKKWGIDPRFEALDRKDREHLLNERVLPLKRAAQEKAEAEHAAVAASFKSMLRERGDINVNSRWSRVKDSLRNDPRYRCVKHEDREVLFNKYLNELKSVEAKAEREAKAKKDEQDKLKERERELRKRKEREEQEMERVRAKVRRKEAVASFQALLVETIKDPLASWTESKPKLEKDPQGRATNPDLDSSDTEKLFREHIKTLYERCVHDFKALLAEVITAEAAAQRTEDGKTVLDSWSTAKRLLKLDQRYNRMPRKERETLWRRYAEEMLRKQNQVLHQKEDKNQDQKSRSTTDSGTYLLARVHDRR